MSTVDVHKAFSPRDGDILATRRALKRPELSPGDRVQVSHRCGDWGDTDEKGHHLNLGTVVKVTAKPDGKGRFFVSVHMDGMPEHDGRRVTKKTARGVELVQNPPLPAFESSLVRLVDKGAGAQVVSDFIAENGEGSGLTKEGVAELVRNELEAFMKKIQGAKP